METLQRTANRGSVSTGFNINNSLKLEDDNTENLYRALNGSTSTTKFTVSMWFKRTELGASQLLYHRGVAGNEGVFLRTSTETNDALQVDIGGSSTNSRSYTSALLRDTSAWYHAVLAVDTTQSTATNRFKLYLNGNLITDFASRANPAEDFAMEVSSAKHRHGAYNDTDGYAGYCGYIAECHYIDGSQVAQTEFGEFDEDSGIWKPKAYTGTYGNNGCYMKYNDSSALGADSSGNGNTFTLNNISAADQATDTPTNNFATLSPLNTESNGGGNVGYTEGATKAVSLAADEPASGSMAITKGKWYFECKAFSNSEIMAGWGVPNLWGTSTDNPGNDEYSFAVHPIGRVYYYGNTYIDFSPSVTFDTNDIVSVAIDADNGFCYWAKNGTYMNNATPTSGATGTGGFNYIGGTTGANMKIVDGDFLVPAFRVNYYTNSGILLNFGGYTTISISSAASDANGYGTFEYAPPTGYYALCTKNLALYGG